MHPIWIQSFIVWTVTQVKVADRTAIETADAETRVVKPSALQELIDTETGGLSFLNPKNKLLFSIKILLVICLFQLKMILYKL